MPELPEVETVRSGLAQWVAGRTIVDVEVFHPRAIRRHAPGADHFAATLRDATIQAVCRRGKYLWLPLQGGGAGSDHCLIAHLGMSGQLLVTPGSAAAEKHLRMRLRFSDGGPELRFVDQRTFGGLLLDDLIPTPDHPDQSIPAQISHIARDPMDPYFDDDAFVGKLRRRNSEIKRALLDQGLVSGVGNIYADEALWRAKISGLRYANTLTRAAALRLLGAIRDVLADALAAGGTSFDSLYVNANGESGYFDRSLAVYGREGEACPRCGSVIRRIRFMNRSSYFCPRCQRPPTGVLRLTQASQKGAGRR